MDDDFLLELELDQYKQKCKELITVNDRLLSENHCLRRKDKHKGRELKRLRRENQALRERAQKDAKTHYKNGKRGTKYNG